MEMGGWSTPEVYKNVYQETFDSERRKADSIIDDYWRKNIEQENWVGTFQTGAGVFPYITSAPVGIFSWHIGEKWVFLRKITAHTRK